MFLFLNFHLQVPNLVCTNAPAVVHCGEIKQIHQILATNVSNQMPCSHLHQQKQTSKWESKYLLGSKNRQRDKVRWKINRQYFSQRHTALVESRWPWWLLLSYLQNEKMCSLKSWSNSFVVWISISKNEISLPWLIPVTQKTSFTPNQGQSSR